MASMDHFLNDDTSLHRSHREQGIQRFNVAPRTEPDNKTRMSLGLLVVIGAVSFLALGKPLDALDSAAPNVLFGDNDFDFFHGLGWPTVFMAAAGLILGSLTVFVMVKFPAGAARSSFKRRSAAATQSAGGSSGCACCAH